ncbi:spherulation-specific family 4 protein [Aquabacterium sp. OR-4]|uniref:spherulation-specific family 4 protein n=1 Tax=Aquabacterium sp. OR-4 TaxID=2978127 RepID=UPI0021B1A716|nr:spherulation-specific family 4 protein [Aquabacterium sp. OR-4]MDT7833598.1 spherulation-specific family 4 protein [Aquabacterium sp. OR-4]
MTFSRTRGALAAAALTLALGPAQALELLVPAYFYPPVWDPAQRNMWREMQQALSQGVAVTAILNPGSGPGTAQDPNYLSAVNDFRAAGGRVLGYVYTCYGTDQCAVAGEQRSAATVLAQAERYAEFYPVDGIFLDEMGGDAALAYYSTVSQALRSAHPDWQLVGNPGAPVPAASAALVDTVMSFEQGRGDYSNTAPAEPWMLSAAPARQAHIHYNVASADQMRGLLAQAVARRAGYIYITDDRYLPGSAVDTNPFDVLPSYWAEEVQAIRAINAAAVPEPATWALWLLGLAGLVGAAGRRPGGRA